VMRSNDKSDEQRFIENLRRQQGSK
jgi:hypothetical protein